MNWLWAPFIGLLATLGAVLTASRPPRWMRIAAKGNHRGRLVPLSLGVALAAGYGLPTLVFGLADAVAPSDRPELTPNPLWLFAAMMIVYAAGVYDDRQSVREHGLGAHFGALARGHVTSGMIKLVAGLVAAALVALAANARGLTLVISIPLIAGTTNLVNLLDVAPGRALKFGFFLAVPLVIVESSGLGWATMGQTAALLPWDVRERAMLGDAGANLLGFVLGYLLFRELSTTGMAIVLAVVLVLHAVAETVTLTRVIRAVPPLRWADDLWRIPAADPTMN